VPGPVSHGSSTATFSPGSPLDHATAYTATVTTGATDAAENPLAESHTWSFRTADPPPPPSGWSAQAIGSARNDLDHEIFGVDVGSAPAVVTMPGGRHWRVPPHPGGSSPM
jgi:hypothetical protein